MRTATIIVALSWAVGCGSEGFDPSEPGATPLNQLSVQEVNHLCREWVAFRKAAYPSEKEIEYGCRYSGIDEATSSNVGPTDADVQAACKAGYDRCTQDPRPPVWSRPAVVWCEGFPAFAAACTGTVDQYAACITEQAVAPPPPACDRLTRADLEAALKPGPACATFDATCE